ncbi:hypothetical protein [Virgibacillus salexigens]|uniref:hypothetical protein n=1 Tax=Virgibacillus salexigens TaxID=61016 RepID=UPI00190CC178|nr:hypothetical protein [Virgibacillus salexigens]
MLDVYQLEEVLKPSMYQQLQNSLFEKNVPFTYGLMENDFSMSTAVTLVYELRYDKTATDGNESQR